MNQKIEHKNYLQVQLQGKLNYQMKKRVLNKETPELPK